MTCEDLSGPVCKTIMSSPQSFPQNGREGITHRPPPGTENRIDILPNEPLSVRIESPLWEPALFIHLVSRFSVNKCTKPAWNLKHYSRQNVTLVTRFCPWSLVEKDVELTNFSTYVVVVPHVLRPNGNTIENRQFAPLFSWPAFSWPSDITPTQYGNHSSNLQ